ncbi:NAD(P)H-dependent oxidoreductase subunit E [Clostridium sp. MB40-C1]|uniref:NADH-quinone oxidoreductase subunit NuoE family protein n=1 Tax=Clostridium sp. MB40-C1 TaxID=3070996 RepID=UPI0027E16E6A|nr:NAD(P)H-dependent oxidoreductase subunit E [Clostridium sp. MB40-C1]WMJ79431.1 NAD(P)H-dependent oxidoreductase subunit E [Clostridium sp. MB40-C1]
MCTNKLTSEKFQDLAKFIDDLEDKQGALIEVLHKAQGLFGYLPEEVQIFVADKLNINVSKVCGVVSFYSYFNTKPRGKYVLSICMGTACFVKGAGDVLKEFEKQLNIKAGETTEDSKFTIDVLRCVGACGLAPVVTVNNKVYGHFTVDMVSKLLKEYSELEG